MESNKLEKMRKKVKEKIAISTIREEFEMKSNKNRKVIYWVTSSVAVFVFGIGIIMGTNLLKYKDNQIADLSHDKQSINQESLKIELKINKMDNMSVFKVDADIKELKIEDIKDEFNFMKNINVPKNFKLNDVYAIYTRRDKDIKKYDVLHEYVFLYKQNDEKNIRIALSKLEKPIRDYIGEGDKISTIGDVQLNVSQYKSLYMVTAKIDDIYIDVETEGITESQLLELLQSLVIEIRSNKNSGIDVDANVKEMANENLDYPSYYAGMFIDNEGKNVILLCEDSIQNRKEICAKLGITQSKTTFKKAKYSYNYLKELQEKISKKMQNKELDFITSSALMEDSNNIKVNVKSKNESDIDKIRQLDKVGGAIDIQYDESTVPKKVLLIEKE